MVSSTSRGAAQEVNVPGLERDEFAPAEAGFDQGLDYLSRCCWESAARRRSYSSGARVRALLDAMEFLEVALDHVLRHHRVAMRQGDRWAVDGGLVDFNAHSGHPFRKR